MVLLRIPNSVSGSSASLYSKVSLVPVALYLPEKRLAKGAYVSEPRSSCSFSDRRGLALRSPTDSVYFCQLDPANAEDL